MSTLEDIDTLIKETLTEEESKFYDELEEQNLWGMLGSTFTGKLGWLAVVMNIVNLVGFGFFIYCAVQFFNTELTNELIRWGIFGFIAWSFMAMIKIFMWMQIHKNTQIREMKRLELQISILSNKLNEQQAHDS